MKNILFVSNYHPLFAASDCGASNRSTMFIAALSQVGHVDVISFRGHEISNIDNCTVIFDTTINRQHKVNRFNKFLNLFAFHSPNKIYPLNQKKVEIINSILRQKHYDFIACRYIWEAAECGLLNYSDRLIIDTDDNLKDMALMAGKNAKTIRNRIYQRFYAHTIDILMKNTLKKLFCVFHSNPLQSPADNSIYLPNVSLLNTKIDDISENTPLHILMVGLFGYGPNKSGMEYFLKHIWPKVNSINKDIVLNIVGRVTPELKAEWEKSPNVVVKGYVQDLEKEYKDARIVIIPIYIGTGTSVKMVEAMNMNRLCISTPQGVRGFDQYLESSKDYLLANNDTQFINHIVQSITDIDRCNSIAHSAKKKVEQYFSKQHFCKIVCESVNNASRI